MKEHLMLWRHITEAYHYFNMLWS